MAQVSVILPTYNRGPLLSRSVESVLAQREVDFELVIVNDGSTDDTHDVLQAYVSDPRLTILLQDNAGVSSARNLGAGQSGGQYLAFIDSDDEWKPGKLKVQLEYLQKSGQPIVQTEETWIRKGARVNPPEYLKKINGDIFLPSLERCMITPSSVMLTRALFDNMGGFDEELPACEDYDLWLRITCEHHVGLIPQAYLVRYAGHPDQLSARYPAMDKFRISALRKRINEGCFSFEQNRQALSTLKKKLQIYRSGCEKRNRVEEIEWCNQVQVFIENQ